MVDLDRQTVPQRRAELVACPGCGLRLPSCDGPTHPYIEASPACWALSGQMLARAYSDAACREVLQLAVDAYACQHPGQPGRRSAQSVGIHLMTLCLVLEHGADPREGPKLHKRMVAHPTFTWLEPPADRGDLTAAAAFETLDAEAYVASATAWASVVWTAWSIHHDTVRAWIAPTLSHAK